LHGLDPHPAGPRPPHLRTDLALVLLSVIWGINFTVVKIALREFDPLAFNGLRFVLASLTLLALLRMRGPIPFPARRHWGRVVLLGLLANVVYQLLFIYGVDRTLAGNAGLVLATTPVWTLILASITGQEHHGIPVWGGVMATLGGMVLVVLGGDGGGGLGEGLLMGDLLLVGASITWATYTVGTQDLTREYGALAVTSWTLWVGTIALVALASPSLWSMNAGSISRAGWLGVAYSGVLALAVAYLIWNHGLEHIGGPRTAAFSNLVPVVALIAASLWLGEDTTPTQIVGAIIIIAGVWVARVAGGRDVERSY
jgi:drug/metabolite transporter (DMT)-like permease